MMRFLRELFLDLFGINDDLRMMRLDLTVSTNKLENTITHISGKVLTAQHSTHHQVQENEMAGELDSLRTAVARDGDVKSSAVTLITGLKAKLDEAIASNDPAALQALSDELGATSSTLAAAVAANTPAGGDPVP